MKPPSASQILREKFARTSRFHQNLSFPPLRDISPDGSERSRSPSVKRKAEISYSNITKRSVNSDRSFTMRSSDSIELAKRFEELDATYATVTSICEKVAENVKELKDPDTGALLTGLMHAISVCDKNLKFPNSVRGG